MMTQHYKPIGWTPTQLMRHILEQNPSWKSKKYSFYGKLDPMAHGLMLILWDEECKNPKYLDMDKRYQFVVGLGIRTDTYDLMGLITHNNSSQSVSISKLKEQAKSFIGPLLQSYPPYSYLKVNGKPLWEWAKDGKLSQIRIPHKEVTIYDLKVLHFAMLPMECVINLARERINRVEGDFRQNHIIQGWEAVKDYFLTVVYLEAHVSSGTYIRNLANQLGGFALEIYRMGVDDYRMEEKEKNCLLPFQVE